MDNLMILKYIMTNLQNKFVVAAGVKCTCLEENWEPEGGIHRVFRVEGSSLCIIFLFFGKGLTSNYHFFGFILTLCLNLLTFFESSSQFFGVLRMEKVTAADIFFMIFRGGGEGF